MRRVVNESAAMKRAYRERRRGAAGSAADVAHACGGHVSNRMALRSQPTTEIRILPIEEISFIESVCGIKCSAPDQHTRARHPVGLDSRTSRGECGSANVVARRARLRKEASQ